jgi:pimeloyl-ACP methyl ester carboxylesterase
MLFVREMLRYAKRFGLTERKITPVQALPDLPGLTWTVTAAKGPWRTQTEFEVLRWDDIVRRDFARPIPVAVILLFTALFYSIAVGGLFRFWRLNWKFGGVIVYPPIMIAALVALGAAFGWATAALIGLLTPVAGLLRLLIIISVAALVFRAGYPLGRRWFVWHLLHDWVFNWEHGMGWRADYESRVDRFASRLVEVAKAGQADEILVVGHSSGAVMAVEIVARALEQEPELDGHGSSVALLTLGSCLPLVALNPRAKRCRDGIESIVRTPHVLWVDYQAPQDWLNFAGFNPVRHMPLGVSEAAAQNPVIRSARFKDIVAPKTYESILFKPFRMHFQFLMGSDRLGEYDYIMMIAGPVRLDDRVRLGEASVAVAHGDTARDELPEAELAAAETDRVAS